jgi:hypothetical protein
MLCVCVCVCVYVCMCVCMCSEDLYEHAMRAGSFYDMDEGASEGIDS